MKDLDIEEDIDLKLEAEIEKLSNFDKIFTNLNEAYQNISDDVFNLDSLYEAANNLSKVKEYDEEYALNHETLFFLYYFSV